MKIFIGFLVVLVTVSAIKSEAEICKERGDFLYQTLGCKPSKAKPDDPCASSYNCSHLAEKGDFCYFQGTKINKGEHSIDGGACNGPCICGEQSDFICPAYDCAEFFGDILEKGCYRTYKLGQCCSTGKICPPLDKVATCEVYGKTYNEGQTFAPKDSCKKCICQKGFEGKFEEPFCKIPSCEMEVRHAKDIRDNCAPIYTNPKARCCPDLWLCETESHVFTKENEGNGKVCKFGNKDVKNGSVLKTTLEQYGQRHSLRCECELPPLVTCVAESSVWI